MAGRRAPGPLAFAVGAVLSAVLLAGTAPVPAGASGGFVIQEEIIGMDFNEARALLRDQDIDVERDDVDTLEFPQSTVGFADPGPGTVVLPDDVVVLFRSSGKAPKGEFFFNNSSSIPSTVAGHLVRGGLSGLIEPRYVVQFSLGCNELVNHMTVRSDGDFASLVHIDVPKRTFTGQTLRLEAGPDAATGSMTTALACPSGCAPR